MRYVGNRQPITLVARLVAIMMLVVLPSTSEAQTTGGADIFTHPQSAWQLRMSSGWTMSLDAQSDTPRYARLDLPGYKNEKIKLLVIPNRWGVTALEWVQYLNDTLPYPATLREYLEVDGKPTAVEEWHLDDYELSGITYVIDLEGYFALLTVEPLSLYGSREVQQILDQWSFERLERDHLTMVEQPVTPLLTGSRANSTASTNWKLPWVSGYQYYYTGGPHGSKYSGLDFAPHPDAARTIQTIESGRILFADWDYVSTFGYLVKMDHGGAWQSWYAHLASKPSVTPGECVAQGYPVGNVGGTGGFDVHIHLDLRRNGTGETWNKKVIDGWTVYDNCTPWFAPSDCLPGAYNGFINKNLRVVTPQESPGPGQLINSTNESAMACYPCPETYNTRGELVQEASVSDPLNCSAPNPCTAPSLGLPSNGWTTNGRSIAFSWNDVNCDHDGYTLRVKTVPNMDSGGETVISVSEDDTERAVTFDSSWDERDLYWSVRAANAPGGASWAPARQFRISPNRPPSISFDTANGSTFSSGRIDSSEQDWSFLGTASDPEGQLSRVEFRCSGDSCGSQAAHTGTTSWLHSQTGIAGQNDVYFVAYDDRQSTKSRHLDLRIDLAPPSTSASLNGDTNPARWPAWFTGPVIVRLQAEDGSTGRARAGVQEVRYRVDGGAWQTHTGSDVNFTAAADGAHSVEYYALDKVGNQESVRTVNFQLDQTPPTAPAGVAEAQGTASDVWQRTTNTPTFTWNASADTTSGVWGYQFYFGVDPNGEAYQTFTAAEPRAWTPQPGGVRTGTYYLRGRTRDNAGNWSPWTSLFTFRYDGAPPENPSGVTHAAGVANDTWQRTTATADFSWPVPHDEGSGIKGYGVYWGSDPAGTGGDFITANQYASGPLCGSDRACTGYLRLRSQDNVDNLAQDWTTAFVLRYDGAPPIADFTFNGGITQTQQTLVTLNLAATDEGSGVRLMQFSGDGETWTPWEAYAPRRQWQIPAISRQWWPVYLRVQDGVGLESAVISHAVYLEVNPDQPRSNNYRLFDHILSAGAGAYNSVGYQGRGTLGQTLDADRSNSSQYTLVGGYEAGSQALPIVRPAHDDFNFVNGIFASGVVAETLSSPTYQMIGTVGELGLPNNQTTLNSGSYQHQPGFLAAQPPPAAVTPTPTPGPTPTPTPTPACAEPLVRINGGAAFTSHPSVELDICSPTAVEMRVSNSEDFTDAQWEPYTDAKTWMLPVTGQLVLPRFVYVAFRAVDGVISSTYFDDIIYDPNAPSGAITAGDSVAGTAQAVAASQSGLSTTSHRDGRVTYLAQSISAPLAVLAPNTDGTVDLYINAMDDNSGMAEMQISADADFTDAAWEPFSALKPYASADGDGVKTVYARFRDEASNVSASAETSFMLDTEAPYGGIALDRRVVGPDVITTTVYLGAEDNLGGVTDVRLSLDPGFGDAAWQPYTSTITWPISLTVESEGTLYGQYRDVAGNVSAVYADTYTVDLTPPQVYVEVEPAETLTRTVHIYAYDELSALDVMTLSNDPLMVEGVVTQSYTDTVTWSFDERRVVWVQLRDSVGNQTEPYPAYAEEVLAPAAVTLSISQDSAYTTLTWQHLSSNRQYEVWRSTIPYLNPDEPDANLERIAVLDPPTEGTTMMYQDANGPYYYLVRALNALGVYADSIRVGRFEFQLVPGGG